MKPVRHNRKIWLVLMSLFLLATLPAVTSAQGRGQGRGQAKKLGKFINGHDARDGRWDGRGPSGTQIGRRDRVNRILFPNRRNRRANSIFVPRNRHWGVDRDGDGDVDRNDFLLGQRQNRLTRLERRNTRRDARHFNLRRR
jgi:hypothetical protein